MKPWTDRAGKLSPLKAAAFVGTLVPALLLAYYAATGFPSAAPTGGLLGPRPFTAAIHHTGDWAIRFLLLSLAVTPLRRIGQWPKLILIRRMLGVAALCYALGHLVLYFFDQNWNVARVVSEIALRIYLTIGFVALLGLVALGATSTDAAISKLGRNWNRLHKIVYGIGILAALHFFMQSKADVYEPTLMAGFFMLLMFYRLAHWRGLGLTSPWVLIAIAVAAALATVAVEAAWYGLATGVPPGRVLSANLQFSYSIRPAWWILATGLGAAVLGYVRSLGKADAPRGRRVARASA
ncbi:sulfite oxidase heme-binding subunit YedZ [Aminobacter aganoensis]|uniref:Protein-methionine-sulfoxide reductase heme-binding subunit MsrQ n=1 Tax=Aminobacter aganoensis TaxID=83264 RepID=A0A7X0F404_9HYPH|nr:MULTISPECIES: protein-methionine-sulfoxide reductase heme-binding subunit MsrQ [Aminobacter]KQU70008.1 ferric reductase [Aminobacter sp. DSM 101952]MBB6352652.1 sulfoxide reductase heme-binding subunit YedZ [Aminobacter aganoensis]